MQDEAEKWLRVLGLAPGASKQAIRDAYRDLVKVWHPDRFGTDPRLRQKAEEKLKEVNAAFSYFQNDRPSNPRRSTGAPSSGTSHRRPAPWVYGRMANTVILSAAMGAVGVWVFLASRRAVEKPSAATALEAPTAQRQNGSAVAPEKKPLPEKRPPTPADPPSVALRPAGPPAESAAAPTTGSLRVESQPTGARIFFDGQAIGETPLVVTDVTPGEHQIGLDLAARGYKRWASSVVITAGREEKLLAVMAPSTTRR